MRGVTRNSPCVRWPLLLVIVVGAVAAEADGVVSASAHYVEYSRQTVPQEAVAAKLPVTRRGSVCRGPTSRGTVVVAFVLHNSSSDCVD